MRWPNLSILTDIAGPCGRAALFLLPLALLHARGVAEILIATSCLLFLWLCWVRQDWQWARSPFSIAAWLWWGWQVICSVHAGAGIGLALAAIRLPMLALASAFFLRGHRRAIFWILAACAGWIAVEAWQQAIFGTNLFGQPRWGDGALTGPFNRPRAGPALILLFFPVMLPLATALASWPGWRRFLVLPAAAAAVLSVLMIGQRMPSALLVLGLGLSALLLPRLRIPVAVAAIAGMAAMLAAPVIAPDTYHKLIVRTHEQLDNFKYSPYGELWVRAAVLARQRPVMGWGYDGFRHHCNDPSSVQGIAALGITQRDAQISTDACNIHPHNYYLEMAVNGGLPLLALFIGLVATLLANLWRCARRERGDFSEGAFIMAVLAFFPIASTSAFASMPNAGWIFLIAGAGLA